MAPNQVIESVLDDCLYSYLENEFDPQEQDQLQIQTGSGVILTVYKNIQSSQKDKKVVLAKSPDKPFLPGADAFPVNPPASRPGRRANSGPKINPPGYRVPPKVVDQGLGGAPNPSGDGNAQFDDKCPAPNKEQSQESSTHRHDFTQKSKIKEKRNQHLNQQIEVNGENFEFERDQIEKKAPFHGTDFGLDPDYGPDGKIIRDRKTGKPRAKQRKLRKNHR